MLGRQVKYLAVTRKHYDNVRANIAYSRLDKRDRGGFRLARISRSCMPWGVITSRRKVIFRWLLSIRPEQPRRLRQSALEAEAFLKRSRPAGTLGLCLALDALSATSKRNTFRSLPHPRTAADRRLRTRTRLNAQRAERVVFHPWVHP